jgi:hypothetical protein
MDRNGLDLVISRLRRISQWGRGRELSVDEMYEVLLRSLPKFSNSYTDFLKIFQKTSGPEKEAKEEIVEVVEKKSNVGEFLGGLRSLKEALDDFFEDFYVFKFEPTEEAVVDVNKSYEKARSSFMSFMKKYSEVLDYLGLRGFSLYEPLSGMADLFGFRKWKFRTRIDSKFFYRLMDALRADDIGESFRKFKGGQLVSLLVEAIRKGRWSSGLLKGIKEWGYTLLERLGLRRAQWDAFVEMLDDYTEPERLGFLLERKEEEKPGEEEKERG